MICISPDGFVYVYDASKLYIVVFASSNGKILFKWEDCELESPTQMYCDDEFLFVADKRAVKVFCRITGLFIRGICQEPRAIISGVCGDSYGPDVLYVVYSNKWYVTIWTKQGVRVRYLFHFQQDKFDRLDTSYPKTICVAGLSLIIVTDPNNRKIHGYHYNRDTQECVSVSGIDELFINPSAVCVVRDLGLLAIVTTRKKIDLYRMTPSKDDLTIGRKKSKMMANSFNIKRKKQ
jgi:hypothetical protein